METVTDFIFLGSKITVDSDYSHEIKRHLLLGRKAMTNLDHVLKSRDITLPMNVCIVKAMIFPGVMCGCESWTIKKAGCWWTVVLEKTLESPLDCKEIQPVHPKGDQSWIFFGRTHIEAETPILWPPDAKNWLIRPWCWERLRAGGEWDDRGWDGWMASLTGWTWVWVDSSNWWWTGSPGVLDMSLSKLQEIVKEKQAWCAAVHGIAKSWMWLNNWTTQHIIYVILDYLGNMLNIDFYLIDAEGVQI